jgi:hypothetical protein
MDDLGITRTKTQDKLATLLRSKAILDARIKHEQSKERSQKRKADTRQKILIGAAFLNDLEHHPEQLRVINETLNRAITDVKQRDFLRQMGWLKD